MAGVTVPLKGISRHRMSIVGGSILMVAILSALGASRIAPHDPHLQDISWRLHPPGATKPGQPPHLLGTDQLGRDILSRIIYGSRVSLAIAFASVILSSMIGIPLGLYAGYYGRTLDAVIMRAAELQLAFPFILLAMAVLSLWGPSMVNIILLFAITSWPAYARILRATVLSLRETSLVESARALGLTDVRILFGHVLANCLSPVIVLASFEVGRMILTESALGFLGLGIQPPTPTWGNMLADGRDYIWTAWWLITFPGLAIVSIVLGTSLLGDALRDYTDPRNRRDL